MGDLQAICPIWVPRAIAESYCRARVACQPRVEGNTQSQMHIVPGKRSMSFMLSASDTPLLASPPAPTSRLRQEDKPTSKHGGTPPEDGGLCPSASQSQSLLISILITSKVIFVLKPCIWLSPTPLSSHLLCSYQAWFRVNSTRSL